MINRAIAANVSTDPFISTSFGSACFLQAPLAKIFLREEKEEEEEGLGREGGRVYTL
jgi:tRNA nucleotidyltransferase (CCA-adding enzyme)